MQAETYPKRYGAWRYFAPACLELDDEQQFSVKIVQQILRATGFSSVEAFNDEVKKHPRGELPEVLQDRLRAVFLGHGEIPNYEFPEKIFVNGAGDLVAPVEKPSDQEPLRIEIAAISIEVGKNNRFRIPLRVGAESANLFAPRDGLEQLCALLMGDNSGDDRAWDLLSGEEQAVIRKWVSSSGAHLENFDDFLDEVRAQLKFAFIEPILDLCTIEFEDEDGDEVCLSVVGDEELGFSFR